MRLRHAFRILTLLAFALFGGALPVAASGEHVVICGSDGVKRIVAYDFETGAPVDIEIAEPACQDCFGFAPILITAPVASYSGAAGFLRWCLSAATSAQAHPARASTARGPPFLIG